jgi:DNA-binding transcriptional LysR family regulator
MSLAESSAVRERWHGVEIRHLAALDAIMREGSFRGAADSLGYVQSAISQQVAHLEDLVGVRLIERSRGSPPVSLTDAGQLMLAHVEAILTRFDAAQKEIAALADGRAGVLRVGAFQSVATRVLPHVIPTFANARTRRRTSACCRRRRRPTCRCLSCSTPARSTWRSAKRPSPTARS